MKLFKLLFLLSLFFASLGNGLAADREAFTFTNYALDLRIEPAQQRLEARGKITLRNDSRSPQKDVFLEISSTLDWRSIRVGGKPMQFVSQPYTSDIDHTGSLSEAIVSLPDAVPPKATIELEVGYEGVVRLDATRLTRIGVPKSEANDSDWDQISPAFTAVRGIGYVVWYPVATESANLSEGNNLFETLGRWKAREAHATMQVTLCSLTDNASSTTALMNDPPRPAVHGTGTDGSTGELTNCGEHVFRPLRETVPAFILANYSLLDRQEIAVHYLPGHQSAAGDYALAADLATPFVKQWFGSPRHKVNVSELADPNAAPFESGNLLLTPLTTSADSRLEQMTVVHQLTHAAFPSPRPWIYEGLAHFAQAVYRERQSGRQAALDFMGLHRTAVADVEKSLAAHPTPNEPASESLINTSLQEFYRSKAMYVWWMLRDMVGETALKKALASYRPEQDKDPAYVETLIEAQSKKDLEWFFDDWVYRDRGLPDFRVTSVFPRQLLGKGYLVTITVENIGGAAAEVPVTLSLEGGEVTKRLQVPARGTASVRIEAPNMPQQVVVNDGSVPESDYGNNTYQVHAAAK